MAGNVRAPKNRLPPDLFRRFALKRSCLLVRMPDPRRGHWMDVQPLGKSLCFLKSHWCVMLKDRPRIERQLTIAQQQVSSCEAKLATEGVTGKARSKNPLWRMLNADYRQLKRRLIAVAAIESRESAAAQRKADKAAGVEPAEA